MRLPRAKKRRGRYSALIWRTGDEASSACFIPNAKLLPTDGADRQTDIDGAQRISLPDGGGRLMLRDSELKQNRALHAFAHRAFAQGRLSLLEDAFTALIVANDVFEGSESARETLAVKYVGCALLPRDKNRWELYLPSPGRPGALAGEGCTDSDARFEEGWSYGDG